MTEESQTAESVAAPASTQEESQIQPVKADVVEGTSTSEKNGPAEPPTLRDFFGLPEKPAEQGDDDWKAFQKKLEEEAKSVRWSAAMPDLGSKIAELLDIKIHNVLLIAWKKVEEVRLALEESKKTPDKATYMTLTEHSVDYETKPFIDVKVKRISVKKLTLHLAMNLKLKGFGLKIQNGAICELQTGNCEARGSLLWEKLKLCEKKFEPVVFPLSIKIPSIPILDSVTGRATETPVAKTTQPEKAKGVETEVDSKADQNVERIEL